MVRFLKRIIRKLYKTHIYNKFKNITDTSTLGRNVKVYQPENLVMAERTNIDEGAVIMNTRAKFIMRKNSGAAVGLTVITGNHMSIVGKFFKDVTDRDKDAAEGQRYDKDVIVDEDVWIGTNVTLLAGSHIKRGAIVGGGSVVRSVVPPYAIVAGNPAKIIGFRFTPEEIIKHETELYASEERINQSILDKNYRLYFEGKIKDINKFLKL